MKSFDDIHSEPNAESLRRDAKFRVHIHDDGTREEQLLEGKVISVSKDGSIDCATTSVAHFYHCGHPATNPMGCACAEPRCANLSCQACSKDSRCARCLKPLCLEHLHKLEAPEGAINLCERHKTDLVRSQRRRAIMRALLKLFIDFESQ